MKSPYARVPTSDWLKVSNALLKRFPIPADELVKVVHGSWTGIFRSRFGTGNYRIGKQIFPQPQIMGFLLHELIPLELERRHPGVWRRGKASTEPDAVCVRKPQFSFEIKTSSSGTGVFGNRSYAHVSRDSRKQRSGFHLVVNFAKFEPGGERPDLRLIRCGWLDSTDWIGQRAQTGQQAHLTPEAKAYKLMVLWESE